jgi:hypothetical protein
MIPRVGLIAALVSLASLLAVGGERTSTGQPQLPTLPTHVSSSLINVSADDVGFRALDYTRHTFIALQEPRVVLARRVVAAELPSLGFESLAFLTEEPPLMLVIVRGDFDITRGTLGTSKLDPTNWHWRVSHIAYVYDLLAGMPILTLTSPRGSLFRRALNDPTLPEDTLPNGSPVPTPRGRPSLPDARPSTPAVRGLSYGAVAPPVEPGSSGMSSSPYGGPTRLITSTPTLTPTVVVLSKATPTPGSTFPP